MENIYDHILDPESKLLLTGIHRSLYFILIYSPNTLSSLYVRPLWRTGWLPLTSTAQYMLEALRSVDYLIRAGSVA